MSERIAGQIILKISNLFAEVVMPQRGIDIKKSSSPLAPDRTLSFSSRRKLKGA